MAQVKITVPYGSVIERVDPLHRLGSLVHLDPANAENPWPEGVPSVVPNLAGGVAELVTGGASSLLPVTDTLTGNGGFVERTAKGGLHFVVSRTNSQGGKVWQANLTSALKSYISASATREHVTFMGAALRVTRVGSSSPASQVIRLAQSSSATRASIDVGGASVYGTAAPNIYVLGNGSFTSPGAGTAYVAVNNATSYIGDPFFHGGPLSGAHVNKAPSWILYETYVEDCTVSGRSWEEARDEFAARTAEKFATVWADDSWSDPVTVMP